MTELPQELLLSLTDAKGFNKESFEEIHRLQQVLVSIRTNPSKIGIEEIPSFHTASIQTSKVPWTNSGYYLDKRPSFTFEPLFHAGCYYVQEASSMFLEQAFTQLTDRIQALRVLDLSAAPGGKSTHLQSLLSPDSLLVSNEVIRARANILSDNIIKWGSSNVMVTNNDPRDFASLESFFDVIVVDAPCSGSGLFRREPEAINEWSLNNVALCAQRQQRILADILPALNEGGVLIFSTCSYSIEEDEDIMRWLINDQDMEPLSIKIDPDWNITETEVNNATGYRFWPDKVKGEGFFLAAFKKKGDAGSTSFKIKNKPTPLSKLELPVIEKWMHTDGFGFIKNNQTVYAWPQVLMNDFSLLLDRLRVVYSGCRTGEIMHQKFVPDHALAMNPTLLKEGNKTDLSYDESIAYLQRNDLSIAPTNKGWQPVYFNGHPLGWINALPNRINNYYPKELRILKQKLE